MVKKASPEKVLQNMRNFFDCSLQDSGARYTGNKMLKKIQNFSVCLGNASAKETAKDLAETFVYNISNDFDIHHHFAKVYDLAF